MLGSLCPATYLSSVCLLLNLLWHLRIYKYFVWSCIFSSLVVVYNLLQETIAIIGLYNNIISFFYILNKVNFITIVILLVIQSLQPKSSLRVIAKSYLRGVFTNVMSLLLQASLLPPGLPLPLSSSMAGTILSLQCSGSPHSMMVGLQSTTP